MEYLTEEDLIEINRRIIRRAGEGSIGVLLKRPSKFSLDVRLTQPFG